MKILPNDTSFNHRFRKICSLWVLVCANVTNVMMSVEGLLIRDKLTFPRSENSFMMTREYATTTNYSSPRLLRSSCLLYWKQVGDDIDGEAPNDVSGHAVQLNEDGTILAIAAKYNDGADPVNSNAGHVRVFQHVAKNKWTQLGQDIDGQNANDMSGRSIGLSADGMTVAVGANGHDGPNGMNSGYVRVFHYSTKAGWSQIGQDIDGKATKDESGVAVSLSGDGTIVAIGAHLNDGPNGEDSGHVRVFQYVTNNNSNRWVQLGSDIQGTRAFQHVGSSVALSSDGTTLVVGASPVDDRSVQIFRFEPQRNDWVRIGNSIDSDSPHDYAGYAVSVSSSGSIVAVGAPEHGGNGNSSGQVRVYQYSTSLDDWVQMGTDIYGERMADHFGSSVSLSRNGFMIAVGATGNDANGDRSGHVRIFSFSNGKEWQQVGYDIDGEASFDYSGRSVSLTSNGDTVAIGAWQNDGQGQVNSGHVRVYGLFNSCVSHSSDSSHVSISVIVGNIVGLAVLGILAALVVIRWKRSRSQVVAVVELPNIKSMTN